MNEIEISRLSECEAIIERGMKTFVDVGNALLEIRENKLYREAFGTFEDYCRERWGMAQGTAYRMIYASEVVRNLRSSPIGELLPTTESQARPLASLEPAQQVEAWQRAVETAPEGKMTAAHVQEVISDFNYKRDMRRTSVQNIYIPHGMDACQTPAYAIDPLLPYLIRFDTLWEPAAGEGLMVDALLDCIFKNFTVIGSDLIDGRNFFEYEPDKWDCLVTNPPYSIKYQWLERCFALGKPFALLMPVEMLGSKTAQELFEVNGIEIMLLNRRVNFKMPNKGWEAAGAPFPTAWFTWGLDLGAQLFFGKLENGTNHDSERI
jgi:hypothetical protein